MKRSPADFFCPESFIVICTFDVSIGFREQLQPRTGGHWKNSWSDASRSSCCNAAGIVPEDTAFVFVVMLKHSVACFPSILHVSSKTPSLLSRTNTSSTCPVLLAVVPSPVLCTATNGVAAGLKLSIDWVWPLSVRKLGSPSPPAVRAWLPWRQHYAFAIYRLQLSVIEMQKTKKKLNSSWPLFVMGRILLSDIARHWGLWWLPQTHFFLEQWFCFELLTPDTPW